MLLVSLPPGTTPIHHLVEHLQQGDAVIELNDDYEWSIMRTYCCQLGHFAASCTFKLIFTDRQIPSLVRALTRNLHPDNHCICLAEEWFPALDESTHIKSLIDVPSIDNPLSHEADYIFVDLARTVKTGFTSKTGREPPSQGSVPLPATPSTTERRSSVSAENARNVGSENPEPVLPQDSPLEEQPLGQGLLEQDLGFHPGTVARLGIGPCAGLHSRSQITLAKFCQPQWHTQYYVRNGSSMAKVTETIIDLAKLLDKVSVNDVSAYDDIALSTLHDFEAMDLSGLAPYVKGSDELGENLQDVDPAKPAMHIRTISTEVLHIRFDFNWEHAFVNNSMDFDRNKELHPTATQTIAANLRNSFKTKGASSLEIWFFPEESFNRHNWRDLLTNLQAFANPYAEFLTNVCHCLVHYLDPEMAAGTLDAGVIFPTPGHHTIWIYNDNASELYGITYNRFSCLSLAPSEHTSPVENIPPASKPDVKPVAQGVMDLFADLNGEKGFAVGSVDDAVKEPGVAPIAKYNDLASNAYQKVAKFDTKTDEWGTPTSISSSKIAWTAGQNKPVDDATRRAPKACPDNVVVRVLSWKREMANLQHVVDASPSCTDTEGHKLASNVDHAMAEHFEDFRARKFQDTHPSCVFASFSEYARGIVEADENSWSGVIAARNKKKPDAFTVNRVKHQLEFLKLIECAVSLIDIIVGTPVALVNFAKHTDFTVHLYYRVLIPEADQSIPPHGKGWPDSSLASTQLPCPRPRCCLGTNYVGELRRRPNEADDEWFKRVSTWISKNAQSTTMTSDATDKDPEHHGIRVPNPPGTQSNIALYYVTTARQTNWPPGFVKPYIEKGFFAKSPHIAVTISRARICTIMIRSGKNTPLIWPINHPIKFLKESLISETNAANTSCTITATSLDTLKQTALFDPAAPGVIELAIPPATALTPPEHIRCPDTLTYYFYFPISHISPPVALYQRSTYLGLHSWSLDILCLPADTSNTNPIFPPAAPRPPPIKLIGAPAGIWTEDLYTASKSLKETEEKRGRQSNREEAPKKGQTAYLTVIVADFTVRFIWKDLTGTIGKTCKVKYLPDWTKDRAQFEAKLNYDAYWSEAMKVYNRQLVVYNGRIRLQAMTNARASGLAFELTSEFSLKVLMKMTLTREVDDAEVEKLLRHKRLMAESLSIRSAEQFQQPSLGF
ncbi:hypothetical protein FBEOM_2748 [Fusarium beomiforme]|uniref:Uncharacterized protein n=1 Tax=Fusarium beomiforme TaxID=44412 RepID=A0A9P5AQX8_9HYPO|nr:hypothetical protein FBEOM_2748 [Fusarium beomiforme]